MEKVLSIMMLLLISAVSLKGAAGAEVLPAKAAVPSYILSGDAVYRSDGSDMTAVFSRVLAGSTVEGSLYYIRDTGDKWIAGLLPEGSDEGFEFDIPGKYSKLRRFIVQGNIFYFLAETGHIPKDEDAAAGTALVRFNPDQKTCSSVEDVADFAIADGKPVLLKKDCIDYNGQHIPFLLKGTLRISGITDSRIVSVSGNEGTELIDLVAGRSIYQYSGKYTADEPDEYNIVFEFSDRVTGSEIPPDPESSIYYEILVDGVEESRTESGRGELTKIFHSSLEPGRFHLIRAERWELDRVKGRYSRMNNVNQPPEMKLFIPENRILKVKIEFTGKGYEIVQSVVYN